ncbi:MAG: hypothetical protein J0L92_04420 [Deltaproteobacteria bacterium]|nr:hypothetical protein [Deltaproteobacteria bacterium]
MSQLHTEWTVLPHGPLTHFDDDIATVQGDLSMPLGHFPRRMTVVRLRDGGLVIFSAIALEDHEMRWLESWGRPAFLVVPNALHRIDAKAWKDRYPTLRVIAPAGARGKVEEVVHVDDTQGSFGDPSVRLVIVPGTREGEAALEVDRSGGTTLVVNDVVWNLSHRGGLSGWVLGAVGMTHDTPHLPRFVEKLSVHDARALADQLDAWAALPRLRRVLVSHGEEITTEPAEALRRIARHLRH